ncbi:MAG TPA: biotin/lipoyl-containing protein [Vicinamibacterales bacterium]
MSDRDISTVARPFDLERGGSAGEVIVREDNRVSRLYVARGDDRVWVFHDGAVFEIPAGEERGRRRGARAHGSLTSPMPATVIAVKVAAGDSVRAGDVLILLEAMKMELPVRAPADATVTAVHCRPGDLVQPNVDLIELA